jgi:hypothetical protein
MGEVVILALAGGYSKIKQSYKQMDKLKLHLPGKWPTVKLTLILEVVKIQG